MQRRAAAEAVTMIAIFAFWRMGYYKETIHTSAPPVQSFLPFRMPSNTAVNSEEGTSGHKDC